MCLKGRVFAMHRAFVVCGGVLLAVGLMSQAFAGCGGNVIVSSGSNGGGTNATTDTGGAADASAPCEIPVAERVKDGTCCRWVAPSSAPQCDSPGGICGEAQYAYRCAVGAIPSGADCWDPKAAPVCGGSWHLVCCYEPQ